VVLYRLVDSSPLYLSMIVGPRDVLDERKFTIGRMTQYSAQATAECPAGFSVLCIDILCLYVYFMSIVSCFTFSLYVPQS